MKNTFRNLTLRQRLLALPFFTLLGLAALEATNAYLSQAINKEVVFPNLENLMMAGEKNLLKTTVDAQAQTLARRLKPLRTEKQRIAAVIAETDSIRFFDDRSGYFFTYDTSGVRIDVPINKKDNGRNFISVADDHGYLYVKAFVEQARAGGGFIDYHFEKPGLGSQPKLGYTTLIPGTDIVIGTGVYIDNVERERAALAAKISQQQKKFYVEIAIVFAVILLVTVALTLLLSNAIAASIRKSVTGMRTASEQVAAAAREVSAQSQSLAQGASEQAAKIQDTAASLEEMAAITRRNTDNAAKADAAARQAQAAADRGSSDMQGMAAAIGAIHASSGDIAKIIRTIPGNPAWDSPWSPTKFETWRSAALRPRGRPPKSEGAIAKTSTGVNLSGKVSGALGDIVGTVAQVVAVAAEVARESGRQTQTIQDVSARVQDMSHVTQSAAASAEESAAASQQLNAQAETMNYASAELLRLVGGSK